MDQMIFFVSCVLVYMLSPVIIVVFIASAALKQLIHMYLKVKYGALYGGMLNNEDLVYPTNNPSKSVINTLMIIDIKSKSFQEFIHVFRLTLKKEIFDRPERYPKLSHTIVNSIWFPYLLKRDHNIDDCLHIIDVTTDPTISECLLQDTLTDCANWPLPNNNKLLWEMLVLSKPLKWFVDGRENLKTCYAIIFRCNHLIGDGLSLVRAFNDMVKFDDMPNSMDIEIMNLRKREPPVNSVTKIKMFLYAIYCVLVSPPIILHQHFFRTDEKNMFFTGELSDKSLYVFKVERTEQLFDMVRKMKAIVPKVTFTDILLTAISASVETLFKNDSRYTPEFITTILTTLMRMPALSKIPVLENNFVPGFMTFPICSESKTLLQKLILVNKYRNIVGRSPDYMVYFILQNFIIKNVPNMIFKPIVKIANTTMAVTNFPGPKSIPILEDYAMTDLISFTPLPGRIGASFALVTFGGRFALGLHVNQALLSRKKAEALVDDVFNKLHLLNDEIQKRQT